MTHRDEIILPDGRVLPLRGARPSTMPTITSPANSMAATVGSGHDRRRLPRSEDGRGTLWNFTA